MSLPCISPGTHPESDTPVVWIRTPYREAFVEELKALLPWRERGWDPDEKEWWALDEHREVVTHLVLKHWPDVLIIGEGGESDYILDRNGQVTEQGRLAL